MGEGSGITRPYHDAVEHCLCALPSMSDGPIARSHLPARVCAYARGISKKRMCVESEESRDERQSEVRKAGSKSRPAQVGHA